MHAKQMLVAAAIALSGSAAMAIEATQFVDTPSTRTRAEVLAELAQARADGTMLLAGGEATQFMDRIVASEQRSREAVRAEARAANRGHMFNDLYVGAANA